MIHFQYQKSICGVTGDGGLVFQPNYCYIHLQYVVAWWKIIFQKSKRPQTHLLMSFNSIRRMACDTFSTPKINLWSDWWWLLGVSSQTIVIFTFNMLLLDGRSFFRSQKDLKLIYLWASIALEEWLVIHCNTKNQSVEWLVIVALCFQPNYCYIFFNMLLLNGKLFFRSQKDLKLIYLSASIAMELWLVVHFNHQK